MIPNMRPRALMVLTLLIITMPGLAESEQSNSEGNLWPTWGNANNDTSSLINLTIFIVVAIVGVILLIYLIRRHDRLEAANKAQQETCIVKEESSQSKTKKDEVEDVIKISKVHNVPYEVDKELKELQKKLSEYEEVIRIAKIKYCKRKLDENSYKEIVKDNQERVIKIEAKIVKIQKNIKKLKTQNKDRKNPQL